MALAESWMILNICPSLGWLVGAKFASLTSTAWMNEIDYVLLSCEYYNTAAQQTLNNNYLLNTQHTFTMEWYSVKDNMD